MAWDPSLKAQSTKLLVTRNPSAPVFDAEGEAELAVAADAVAAALAAEEHGEEPRWLVTAPGRNAVHTLCSTYQEARKAALSIASPGEPVSIYERRFVATVPVGDPVIHPATTETGVSHVR